MEILITGGTGFVGRVLCLKLLKQGDSVTILTRDRSRVQGEFPPEIEAVESLEEYPDSKPLDVVINLAGAPIVAGRWTEKRKKIIMDSRSKRTDQLVESLGRRSQKPKVLLSASAVGYYGYHESKTFVEGDSPQQDFLSKVTQAWETSARRAENHGIRVCLMRIGVVLGRGGGPLAAISLPFRFGFGGKLGSGEQWVPWVHVDDLIQAMLYLINQEELSGPVNLVSPNPVQNLVLTKILGETMNRPTFIPAPAFAIKFMLGEMAELILQGQKVHPQKLLDHDFPFRYSHLREALKEIYEQTSISLRGGHSESTKRP